MSGEWTIARLGSLTEISYGFTESASWERVGPRFLRITDIQPDGVDWDAVPYCPVNGSDLGKFRLAHDDIVFARTGATTGKSHLVQHPPESVFASYLIRMRLQSQALLPRFLHLFFQTAEYWKAIDAGSSGSAQGGFNASKLGALKIKFPAIGEQERIVAILDEAFEGIATAKANAEKNLQNARELFTTRLESTFGNAALGWRSVPLETIGATQTGSTPKSSEPENLGDFLPFVKPGDFNRDGTITLDNDGLSEQGAIKARRVPPNSALMVCIGATIGKAGFTDCEIATNQQVNAWTPIADMSAKFMYYQMTSKDFQLRVRQNAGQATLPIINKSKWSALTVSVPPTLDEQIQVVARLDALLAESMSLEAIYERKLAALDELKKSLLHQAFSGRL